MLRQFYQPLHGGKLLGKTLLSLLLVCCLTDVACSQTPEASREVDLTRRRIDLIPPGTIIESGPPRGWSHLIIKSRPRPGAGDVNSLSQTADRLARMLFTAIVAQVSKDESRKEYRLRRVAVGIGADVGGKDMVLSPESQRRLGAGLSFLARVVLSKAQDKLHEITIPLQSSTLVLIDAPGLLVVHERHVAVVLRYALLVQPQTGKVDTLLWAMRRNETSGPIGSVQWLAQNKIEDCVLHVDAEEFALGTPTENAFAMTALPRGKSAIAVPDDMKEDLVRDRFTAAQAADLQGKLRKLLDSSP